MPRALLFSLAFFTFFSCQKEKPNTPAPVFPALMEIPEGFPEVEHLEGNEFSKARWDLGKKLFFDPIMSADTSISCASCHLPSLAFSDDKAFSVGVENRLGTRNSPTLANVAYHPYYTREGGLPTLEMQTLVPIQEHNEFDFNIVLIAERLANDTTYTAMTQTAYNRTPDAFVISRALACFERSLLSGNSFYDQYATQNKPDVLTESQQRGMDLFFSQQINCATCHSGFNFTNYAFENNGLYEEYSDTGRFRLTGEEVDIARFKVPSLRNIALTAPYMHDGSLATLAEVIAHYNTGGANHIQKNPIIQPLDLTENEQADLVHFLEALTDETFVHNPLFAK